MPLLLLDLDNTLLDRAAAVRTWAEDFLRAIGAPAEDIDWLLDADADGLTDRWDLADALRDRYLLRTPLIDLVEGMRDGVVHNTRLDPRVACALCALCAVLSDIQPSRLRPGRTYTAGSDRTRGAALRPPHTPARWCCRGGTRRCALSS